MPVRAHEAVQDCLFAGRIQLKDSAGIGYAIAEALAKEGASFVARADST
jgi:hypothetical protein